MATSKKRSKAARAKRKSKRPATKRAAVATGTRKKSVANKTASRRAAPAAKRGKPTKTAARSKARKKTVPKKTLPGKPAAAGKRRKATGAAAKSRATRKVAAPKRKVASGRPSKAAPRRARRPAARVFFNPQAQIEKLSAATAEPAARATRGVGMARGTRGVEGPTMPEGFFGAYTGAALTEQDFAEAAQTLGCEVAAVKAVAQVETAGASFDASHRPTILYECHVFSRNTAPRGKFNESNPDVSAARPYGPGKYGSRDEQYVKLAKAFQLDEEAALKAPSWGKFQILGENYRACGFSSVADFVKAMTTSEGEHLKAFVKFLLSNPKRAEAIRNKDWATLARLYNGPNYAQFKYDTKLATAYAQFA